MADLSPEKIIEPISEDQPCGPDLDMEDMDYMNFMAAIEGHIPDRYFSFDPETIDFANAYKEIDGFLDKARDLRLLVLLAQLKILNGNTDGFIEALVAIDALLKAHWNDVHPCGDMMSMRMPTLATLDDMPTSILPLQHANLFRSRRSGAITLRKWLVAKGDTSPREDEDRLDAGTILDEIANADGSEMAALLEKMRTGLNAVSSIRTVCISEGDFESAPTYERLTEAFEGIIDLLAQGTGADAGGGDEAETEAADGDEAAVSGASVTVKLPTGDVQTRESAIDALFAAEKYYALYEPSSPVVLLLREARASANKTFAELVAELLPSSAREAFFTFGKEPWFEVPLNDINGRNPAPDYEGDEPVSNSSWEDAGLEEEPTDNDRTSDDGGGWTSNNYGAAATEESKEESSSDSGGWTSNNYGQGAAEETAQAAEAAPAAEPEPEPEKEPDVAEAAVQEDEAAEASDAVADEPEAAEAAPEPVEEQPEPARAAPRFTATTRPEALALIEKVLAYYRAAEPSSPVALILERAVALSSKNFIGLLSEVLPQGHLRVKEAPAAPKDKGGWS